jgi:hypothetical protein
MEPEKIEENSHIGKYHKCVSEKYYPKVLDPQSPLSPLEQLHSSILISVMAPNESSKEDSEESEIKSQSTVCKETPFDEPCPEVAIWGASKVLYRKNEKTIFEIKYAFNSSTCYLFDITPEYTKAEFYSVDEEKSYRKALSSFISDLGYSEGKKTYKVVHLLNGAKCYKVKEFPRSMHTYLRSQGVSGEGILK